MNITEALRRVGEEIEWLRDRTTWKTDFTQAPRGNLLLVKMPGRKIPVVMTWRYTVITSDGSWDYAEDSLLNKTPDLTNAQYIVIHE